MGADGVAMDRSVSELSDTATDVTSVARRVNCSGNITDPMR